MLRPLLVMLIGMLALTPLAAAQATLEVETEWAHPEKELPETGRADVPLTVNAKVTGTTECAAEQEFTIDLTLETFTKWAGGSLLPPSVTFKIPMGPIVGEQKLTAQETVLNLAWNVDDAPRFNAEQEYVVIIRGEDVAKSGGPCLPDVTVEDHTSQSVRAYMLDRPEVKQELPCSDDPYQPKCLATSAEPVPPTPAVGPLVLILIIALAGLVRRRFA